MINLKKLLRNSLFLLTLFHTFFFGCNKEPETKKYIARVNNAFLTEEELSESDSLFKHAFSRSELIKKWVDKELLYQEAVKLGLPENEEFNRIINNSRRELASSMLMNIYVDEKLVQPTDLELYEYYNVHQNEFRADADTYLFNYVCFSTENTAIKFRTKLFKTEWEELIENYADDKALVEYSTSKALSKYEIHPIKFLNLIEQLNPGEVSIVFEENSEKYSVVQLLEVFRKGAILNLSAIREEVETRYNAERREQIFSEYLKDLYSNNEIEIKQK